MGVGAAELACPRRAVAAVREVRDAGHLSDLKLHPVAERWGWDVDALAAPCEESR